MDMQRPSGGSPAAFIVAGALLTVLALVAALGVYFVFLGGGSFLSRSGGGPTSPVSEQVEEQGISEPISDPPGVTGDEEDPVSDGPAEESDEEQEGPMAPPTTTDEPEGDFVSTYDEVSDGVVRVAVGMCGDYAGMGSGALVANDLVLTAAHVVQGYSSIQLQLGDQAVVGEVVGYSPGDDLALVSAERPLSGHIFEVSDERAPVGTPVAALGYPLSGPLSFSGPGTISTHDEPIEYGESGIAVPNAMRISTAINPGNSGGPLIDADGEIVGVVTGQRVESTGSAVPGYGYAVPSDLAAARVDDWRDTPEPLSAESCDFEEVEEDSVYDPSVLVTSIAEGPDVDAVTHVYYDYFDGINSSDYERAYAQRSERNQSSYSLEAFSEDQSTSVIEDVLILDVSGSGDTRSAVVTFLSWQAPKYVPEGESCAYWTVQYELTRGGPHGWVIDDAGGYDNKGGWDHCFAD
ncbi:S1C family serine protease [Brachybacterium aquaticum]|uniref:Serine protease n=1 Tax=Brachybacterium aquaticum TaxID=1432564 RepID=A0A841AIB1_9MICO|nr:serine protease [Brachybacterium aquaticum]MBB5832778.1 hypothetical protein [Brachybacterium aquaticum]